jgi:hypothetical protein
MFMPQRGCGIPIWHSEACLGIFTPLSLLERRPMTRRTGTQRSRAAGIDGSKCLPSTWTRFSSELTTKFGGRKLHRDLILNNRVSCSIAGPTTHRDVIIEIARRSYKTIQIESLPDEMDALLRGKIVFGCPGNHLDKIARNYDGMYWWMSACGLNMGIPERTACGVLPFDKLAGNLMYEAWLQGLPSGRIPASAYWKICTALDESHFRPLDYLKGKFRKSLAEWNQKHHQKPINSFHRLYTSNVALARRGMLTRLNRAKAVWVTHKNLSAQ